MANHSGWRIDLEKIWNQQRLSPALCDALKVVLAAAHAYVTTQPGNPGEAVKREACWAGFKDQRLDTGDAWQQELANAPFLPASSETDALAQEWESVRHYFISDTRSVADMEAITGKQWISSRKSHPISRYAEQSWEMLQSIKGMGPKKLRGLVEMLSAAAKG